MTVRYVFKNMMNDKNLIVTLQLLIVNCYIFTKLSHEDFSFVLTHQNNLKSLPKHMSYMIYRSTFKARVTYTYILNMINQFRSTEPISCRSLGSCE